MFEKTVVTRLLDSAIVIALGSAALYCFSTARYYGFLRVFRLEPNVLDRNFHQILYDGLIITFYPVLLVLIAYFACRLIYSYAFLPNFIDYFRSNMSRKRRLIKLKERWKNIWNNKRRDSNAEIIAKGKTHEIGMVFLICFAFLGLLALFEQGGERRARSYLENISSNSAPVSSLISVYINEENKKLYFLACGARNCAGIEPNTNIVHYFPQEGYSYRQR